MRVMRLPVLLSLAFVLAACVPVVSLNPLYTAKDIVFDPALVGTWTNNDEDGVWIFQKRNDQSYDLIVRDDEKKEARFVVHLVKLGTLRFLDIYSDPKVLDERLKDVILMTLPAPGHFFLTLTAIEPTLQMAFLDDDWVEKLVKSNPAATRGIATMQVTEQGDNAVLVGSTEELQTFVVANVNTTDAFNSVDGLRRRP